MRQQPQQPFEPHVTSAIPCSRRRLPAGLTALVVVPLVAFAGAGCGSAPGATSAVPGAIAKVVRVAVLSPAVGSVTSAGRVTVRGTVAPADAVVLVQGRPAVTGNGVFTATATVQRGHTTIDVIATAHGAAPGSASVAVSRPALRKARQASSAIAATVIAPAARLSTTTACGDGLAVGPNTSCSFAENVREAYQEHGPGSVMAYSPATRRLYAMSCSATASVMCTGGNDASVYFTGQIPSRVERPSGTTACGDGLAVGPNTTCPFAANVRAAYRQHGPGTVRAFSPVTRRTYVLSCSRGALVVCTGGDHATVSFP
jgi:hypothetical protein